MSVTAIGPVVVSVHGDPSASRSSTPTSRSGRDVSIQGYLEWDEVEQLSELVANSTLQRTIGGVTGVLEYISTDDDLLAGWNGWYLLTGFSYSPEQQHSLNGVTGLVPFSLAGAYIGGAGVCVVAESDPLANVHGVVSEPLAALMPSTADPALGQMRVYADGVLTVRPYDTELAPSPVGEYGSFSGGY